MDITIASVVGAFSGAAMIYATRAALREGKNLDDMKNAGVFSPQELTTSLQDPNFLSTKSQRTENPDERVIKAFIEGQVTCEKPLKSAISEGVELVHRVYNKKDLYSNDMLGYQFKADPKSLKYGTSGTEVRAPLLFKIKDSEGKASCEVHRSLLVDASDAIVPIAERVQSKKLDWFDKTLIFLGVVAEALRSCLSKSKDTTRIRGILIGFNEREFGIRVNSALTVFGDVVYNSKEGSLRIESPLFYLQKKVSGLKIVKNKMIGHYFVAALFGLVVVGCGYYLCNQAIKRLKRRKEAEVEKETDKLKNTKKLTLENGYKCVCCREEAKNVILKPCLHFSLCKGCFDKLKQKKCPVCKATVSEGVDIYFS